MPQEENEHTWYEGFKSCMTVVFTKEDFTKYQEMVEHEIRSYQKYLKPGARILDVGCGLGCEAVPLSALGYDVTGIDNDPLVVKAARKNAKNFGRKMKVVEGDIFEIDKLFGKDSFDACISGGVLEHFPEEQVRKIMDKQLYVAPIVIASMPIAEKKDVRDMYKDYESRICSDGVYRNMWLPDYWVKHVFKGYDLLHYGVERACEAIGGFEMLLIVAGRKIKRKSSR